MKTVKFFLFTVAICFLAAFNTPVISQIIHTESFDTTAFPPGDWTRTGGFNSRWTRVATGINPPATPHSGPGMARFNVGGGPGSNGATEQLISPRVSYVGASGSTPTVSIWMWRESSSTAGDSLSIFINTNNNLSGAEHIGAIARSRFFVLPTNEPSDGWYQYTFNVPATFNTDTNYIILRGTSRGQSDIYIDDVQWDEYLAPCTGAPVAGNVLTSDTLVCGGGGNVTLSLTGNNTGGGISYQWQWGPTDNGPWTDFGPSAGVVNSGPLTADSTWFRCYVTCSNGGVTDTSSITLVKLSSNPPPAVSLNVPASIDYCPGDPAIGIVASGAQTYTWTPDISINTTGDSAVATPAVSTLYTVTGSDSSGCTGSTGFSIIVGDAPGVVAIASQDTICAGDLVDLDANIFAPPFGQQIEWQPGGMTQANVTVTPLVTTTYTITVGHFFFDCDGIDSVTVVVLPAPTAGFSYSINNQTVTFTDTSQSAGSLSYLWDFGDNNSDTIANPVHTYTSIGIYTVTLTVSNGTCSNTFTQTITVGNVGVAQFGDGRKITVYPNPVSDLVTIEFDSHAARIALEIIDISGRMITRKEIIHSSITLFRKDLDLSSLTNGNYFIRIVTEDDSAVLKIQKL